MPKRVLVVDDDGDTLFGLKEMLESVEVDVSTAESKEQALVLLKTFVYDLVIADLMLGSSSPEGGLTLLLYVKEHARRTKTIVITGCGEPDIMERACEAGATLFYTKPVAVQVLKDAMRRFWP